MSLLAAAVHAAPAGAIGGLVGEWSGESQHTVAGEAAGRRIADVRRYWAEGDAVRGEILTGGGDSLRSIRTTIVPRGNRFLKILSPENGDDEIFLGFPAENGVMWTRVSADRVRYIERVTGSGDDRRLELLLPEGDSASPAWRVAETLKPAQAALTGVVGGGAAATEPITPLVLPSPEILTLIDRVGDLLEQRDSARSNTANIARELAGAWRELEDANAKVKSLETQVTDLRTRPAPAAAPAAAGDLQTQLQTAEKDAVEARRWADELEKSLRAANTRADEAAARADELGKQIADAGQTAGRLRTERDEIAAKLSAQNAEAQSRQARIGELEGLVAQLQRQVTGATQAALDAAKLSDALARLSEYETTLTTARAEVEKLKADQTAAAEQGATLRAENTRLTARIADLNTRLTAAGNEAQKVAADLAAAQTQIAALTQEKTDLTARLAGADRNESQTAGLEQQLATLTRERDAERRQLETQLAEARAAGSSASAETARLEKALAGIREENNALNAAKTDLEAQLAEARKPAPAAGRAATLERELEAARNALTLAEARERDAQRVIAEMRSAAESAAQVGAATDADLGAARARVVELEQESATAHARVAELERQLDAREAVATAAAEVAPDARVQELETRLAATFARAEERQREIDRLHTRVAALEAERNALAARSGMAAPAPTQTATADDREAEELRRRLAEAEIAQRAAENRNRELAAQQFRDTRVVATPSAPRPAPAAQRPVVASAPAADEIQFSLSRPTPPASTAGEGFRAAPTRPAAGSFVVPAVAGDDRLNQAVSGLSINGYRRAGNGSVVIVGGRAYRIGETVDSRRGLRFVRIDADAIVFSGPTGGEYRYRL